MLRRAFDVLVCVLTGFACPSAALAVTSGSCGGYSIHVWQTEDGLPQNAVTAITQTHDGYLWFGTMAGLARFDGERFVTFDSGSEPRLPDDRVSALFEDRDGTLWIGHDTGLISRYRHGRFELLPGEPGARAKVAAIGADEHGTVWLLRTSGVIERVDQVGSKPASPLEERARLVRFARDAKGRIRFSVDGGASELRDGKIFPLDLGPAQHTGYVRGLCASSSGGWWIVRDGRIRRRTDGVWSDDRGEWGASEINASLELHDGTLAFASMDDGVHLVRPDGGVVVFDHQSALIQNWARTLYEDREGNLWIGAGSGGVAMVRRAEFNVLNSPDNWQGRTVLSVVPSGAGALWVGTEGGGVYRYNQGQWKTYGLSKGFENLFIWSVTLDDEGRIWAGTWGDGVYRLEGERFVRAREIDVGSAPVFALRWDSSDRSLWAGTGNGLLHVKDGKSNWFLHEENPTPVRVLDMARDAGGVTWLALDDDGLGRLADSGIKRFNRSTGFPGRGVQCLRVDGDTLWIGTRETGLFRLKNGRFSGVGVPQGLPSKVICHIADDGRGYLWLSTHHGIFRVAKAQLNRCADGEIPVVSGKAYDRSDGLPTLEFSGGLAAAGCRSNDGRLWFTSGKGLVSVDPAAVRINARPPPVVIEALKIDGQRVGIGSGVAPRLRLPPGHQRLEFQYTALSFAAPAKTFFKYRLTGLDAEWIDAGTKRTASYSHLPAGDYRFEVIACNNDGVWNLRGADIGFTVLPFYWQTWWFRGGAAILALSAVAGSARHETRRRMQRRVEELEYERGIERERARIAQDIHDDIGSSLTRITMLSQSVCRGMDDSCRVAPVLDRIHHTALEVTHTLDEIVWALDPQHDTLDSLACYLVRFAQERLGEASLSCRLDLPMNLPAWPLGTQMRHNLLLAFKEALNNTIKHARATEVRVALELGRDEFAITLRDNGCGFDQAGAVTLGADASRGGRGLGSLRHRLAQIGGHCDIVSAPGRGTCVAFTVRLSPETAAPPRTSGKPAQL